MFRISQALNKRCCFSIALLCLMISTFLGASPSTQHTGDEKVDVGLFVQSTTWHRENGTDFPMILRCAVAGGSRVEGCKLYVIDGREWEGESAAIFHVDNKASSQIATSKSCDTETFLVWFYEYKDAQGHDLEGRALNETEGPMYPYPQHYPQIKLSSSEDAYFFTSLYPRVILPEAVSKLVLHAYVVLEGKIVGRSKEVTIELIGSGQGDLPVPNN